MKKTFCIWAIVPMLCFSGILNAQMDNLANLSAKWIRSTVRNATLDGSADMVNFNPAGLALLNDGLYLSLSNQTMFRHPKHSFNMGMGEQSYEQDNMDPFVPMFYAAYKKSQFAVSSGMYISGGGGSAKYPDGSVNTNLLGYGMMGMINFASGANYTAIRDQSLDGSSFYLTVPLALSYAITDKISVSAGARYIRGINRTKAELTYTGGTDPDFLLSVDYKTTANGFGGVFGVNYLITEKLNFAVHFETKVKLEFEADDNKGTYALEADGEKSRRDLPAVLNTGVTYKITDQFMAAADFNWYFQSKADWGSLTDPATLQEIDAAKTAGDCYTANLGFYYQLKKLQLSAGGSYTAFLYDDQEMYYTKMGVYETLKYNNLSVGFGVGYKLSDKIDIDLGIARTFWKDETVNSRLGSGMPVEISNKAYVLAIGVDFKL